MDLNAATLSRRIGSYLVFSLVFLLWENLVSSFLGVYHLELRRTLWGLVYYCLLFLCFGGLVEIFDLIYRRFLGRFNWPGQRCFWFLTLLVVLLWGDLYRQLLIQLFSLALVRESYKLALSWVPLALLAAVFANFALAKRNRRKPFTPAFLPPLAFSFLLYLILSTKIAYTYFPDRPFSLASLLLQPLFLAIALVVSWSLSQVSHPKLKFGRLIFLIPLVLTPLVILLSSALEARSPTRVSLQRPPTDRPNVIILLFDALRADHVGATEPNGSLTPTIDRVAAAGRSYPVCRSVSSWTAPCVASLLTSRLPHKLGLMEERIGLLPAEIPVLTDLLHGRGYYTVGLSANDLIAPKYGYDRVFQELHFLRGRGSHQLLLPIHSFFPMLRFMEELAYQFNFCSTDLVAADWMQMNQKAVKLLEQHAATPFFLYLHYIEPHTPYIAAPFQEGLWDWKRLKASLYLSMGNAARTANAQAFIKKNTEELLETEHQRYRGSVQVVDGAVKDMLENLDRLGLAEHTIIIITADHGEEFMEHGRWGHKNSIYEESVRIPLIIYTPPGLQMTLPQPSADISQVDIAPTILELVGLDTVLSGSDGRSLLQAGTIGERPSFLSLEVSRKIWRGVVVGSSKLIVIKDPVTGANDTLFYDLVADSREQTNLFPAPRAQIDSLGNLLEAQFDQPTLPYPKQPVKLTPQEMERLRALGYTN